jgi:hypothetical protein
MTFALISTADLADLLADIAALKAALDRATVIPAPEWVSVAEAQRLLDCSEATVRRKIADGSLEAKGAGKLKRVRVG